MKEQIVRGQPVAEELQKNQDRDVSGAIRVPCVCKTYNDTTLPNLQKRIYAIGFI